MFDDGAETRGLNVRPRDADDNCFRLCCFVRVDKFR